MFIITINSPRISRSIVIDNKDDNQNQGYTSPPTVVLRVINSRPSSRRLTEPTGNTRYHATAMRTANNDCKIKVVFILLDSVKSEYNSYRCKLMPWLSVPFVNLHA
jgi:hypothetical protein